MSKFNPKSVKMHQNSVIYDMYNGDAFLEVMKGGAGGAET
jgi:hypothetical protein